MKKFNQKKYIAEYKKTHYKRISVEIKIELYDKLMEKLTLKNKTKASFIKDAIVDFLEK